MKVVIIDDDRKSCLDLKGRLQSRNDMEVAGVAYNGFDGLELINRTEPDVVFLDVELPDISGLDFLERSSYTHESNCRVIIYTAYDKYVLPALRKRAFDVLLKPIEEGELEGVLERLNEPVETVEKKVSEPEKDDPRYVLFTNSVDFTIIGKGDIGIFQYDPQGRFWSAVVAGLDKPVRLRSKITAKNLMQLGPQYVQVHQRFIINADYLLNVVDSHCHFFPPFDRIDYVVVGRVYRDKLLDRFMSL